MFFELIAKQLSVINDDVTWSNIWICLCIFSSIREGVHCAFSSNGHLVIYGGQQGPNLLGVEEFVSRVLVPMHLYVHAR